MSSRRRQLRFSCAVATVVLSASAAACGGGSDKSGGDAPTTTPRMATMEGRGSPDADNIEVPPRSTGSVPSEFPEGVYRADRRAEDLIEQGMDPLTAHNLAGLVTLTFENGRWRDYEPGIADCRGPYSVEAGRIFLRIEVAQCGAPARVLVMSARWTLAEGELRFFDFTRGRPLEWRGPWTKID